MRDVLKTSTEKITKSRGICHVYELEDSLFNCLIVNSPQIDLYILYNHSQNPRKFFFVGISKLPLKCVKKCKGLRITKTISMKNKIEGFTLPDINT